MNVIGWREENQSHLFYSLFFIFEASSPIQVQDSVYVTAEVEKRGREGSVKFLNTPRPEAIDDVMPPG